MAKAAHKTTEVNIDLLPKEDSSKTGKSLIHWVLTIGRYLIIVTEVVALATFVFGILLSKEKNDLKDSISSQVAQIKALQNCDANDPNAFCEKRFLKVQTQLNQISTLRASQFADNKVISEFLKLLPTGITLETFAIEKNTISFTGSFPSERELQTLITSFNSSQTINNLDITNLTKEDKLKFTATATVNQTAVSQAASNSSGGGL